MRQNYLCILNDSSRSQGLTGTPFLSKPHKFPVGLEQRHTKMGMSLGLYSRSCAAPGFSSLLAFGVFNLVNGKNTEGYGCVGSWEEIIPLLRSSAEAWAAGGGFGQFMERRKWMGIFSDLPRLCHRNPLRVWSSLAEHREPSIHAQITADGCVCAFKASFTVTAVMWL